jgi:hypothetical protein
MFDSEGMRCCISLGLSSKEEIQMVQTLGALIGTLTQLIVDAV